jgi:hypothetical protein
MATEWMRVWFKERVTMHVKGSNPKIFRKVDPQKITKEVQFR